MIVTAIDQLVPYLLTEVLCNSSSIWAPIGIIWQKMTLQKYLIKLEFTKRTTDITGFLLAQDATVCNFFPPVLRWRNVTVQLLFLIMNIFILLIKVITFLIPVSPTANRQIDKKTRIYNTKNHTAIFLHRSNCQILIRYRLCPFRGMDLHPQPQRTVTEGNDSICLPANASTFLLDLNNAVIMEKNIQWTTAL